MITPTRTVCYAIPEEDAEQELKVANASPFGLEIEYSKGLYELLSYSELRRIIVREELIEQYHPLIFHTKDLSDLKIEPGEVKRYSLCNKNFNPLNPCACGDCGAVLNFFSNLKELPL